MIRKEFLSLLARERRDEVVVTTMGAVRDWGHLSQCPELDFVSADSAMGHAADLALGLALARPRRRVICFNGDGSMLMNLGTLATMASTQPHNLVLVVLQNGVYELTGRQPIPGIEKMNLARMAQAAGIEKTFEWRQLDEVERDASRVFAERGPIFALAHLLPGSDGPILRGPELEEPFLRTTLAESAHALRAALESAGE